MGKKQDENSSKKDVNKTCGIIMPIADHSDYPLGHWNDVLEILKEAVFTTEFDVELVSNDGAIGLIQDRIVTNVYNNEIVVCDVSSKNPNVMFELGMRLAFDKPTIIIKDDKTGYSFDIGGIEHIPYPSSLRFADIVDFKEKLVSKINATYKKSQEEPNYSPFLKSFGRTIKPSSIEQTEISETKYIIDEITELKRLMYSVIPPTKEDTNNRHYSSDSAKQKINDIVETLTLKNHDKSYSELSAIISKILYSEGIAISDSYLRSLIKSKMNYSRNILE